MKKAKVILLAIVTISLMMISGCGYYNSIEISEKREKADGRIVIIYNDGMQRIIQDAETGVQYLVTTHGVCVMVDQSGKPYRE